MKFIWCCLLSATVVKKFMEYLSASSLVEKENALGVIESELTTSSSILESVWKPGYWMALSVCGYLHNLCDNPIWKTLMNTNDGDSNKLRRNSSLYFRLLHICVISTHDAWTRICRINDRQASIYQDEVLLFNFYS